MRPSMEGEWETVGAHITQRGGDFHVEVAGAADPAAVKAQVARLLSVDVDASDFEEVGAFLLRVRRDRQMPE